VRPHLPIIAGIGMVVIDLCVASSHEKRNYRMI